MQRTLIVLFVLALAGCADASAPGPEEGDFRTVQQAVGEPQDGFPSWAERVAWVWSNRARQDPEEELADCTDCADRDCYAPNPPLTWSHELGRAARFHSDSLVNNGLGIQHDSPCDLVNNIAEIYEPGACNGEASCACQGGQLGCAGDCPRFSDRVALFGGFPGAENVHSTGNPVSAIYGFTHEPYDVSECGRGYDSMNRPNGHRVGVLNGGPSVGIGIGEGGRILTMDFGGGGGAPSKLVSGVHYPESGGELEFRANWYDEAGPTDAIVNVEGECAAMTVERGTPENGTFLTSASVGGDCTRYRFEFTDAAGTTVHLPETGSYAINCTEEYLPDPPPMCGCTPECSGKACGDDGCGSTCGSCADDQMCTVEGQCVAGDTNNDTPTNNAPSSNNGTDGSGTGNDDGSSDDGATDGAGGTNGDEPGVVVRDSDADVAGEGRVCAHTTAPSPMQGRWFVVLLGGLFVLAFRRR